MCKRILHRKWEITRSGENLNPYREHVEKKYREKIFFIYSEYNERTKILLQEQKTELNKELKRYDKKIESIKSKYKILLEPIKDVLKEKLKKADEEKEKDLWNLIDFEDFRLK